jgi:hypothetical protein
MSKLIRTGLPGLSMAATIAISPLTNPGDGRDDGQQHRQQGVKRDEQHHCGRQNADHGAEAQRRLLGVPDRVAAELDVQQPRPLAAEGGTLARA